ncbi:hypothetical protein STEG23_022594, partial [Scotinomys teguina]
MSNAVTVSGVHTMCQAKSYRAQVLIALLHSVTNIALWMASADCQLERISNHPGDNPLVI